MRRIFGIFVPLKMGYLTISPSPSPHNKIPASITHKLLPLSLDI